MIASNYIKDFTRLLSAYPFSLSDCFILAFLLSKSIYQRRNKLVTTLLVERVVMQILVGIANLATYHYRNLSFILFQYSVKKCYVPINFVCYFKTNIFMKIVDVMEKFSRNVCLKIE